MNIYWTEKIKIDIEKQFHWFVQQMAFRIIQGYHRYGPVNKKKKYLTRLKMEIKKYEETGNCEHLLNACVYGVLESAEPENRKYHYDNTVESVTRGKV